MELKLDSFKKVANTVFGIEQEIARLLEIQKKSSLTEQEAVKLENFKTNSEFKDEYENVLKDIEFGSLPETTRVELVRKDIDRNILGEAA